MRKSRRLTLAEPVVVMVVVVVVVPLVKNPATFSYSDEKERSTKCKIITLSTIASFSRGFSSRAATRFTREKRRRESAWAVASPY